MTASQLSYASQSLKDFCIDDFLLQLSREDVPVNRVSDLRAGSQFPSRRWISWNQITTKLESSSVSVFRSPIENFRAKALPKLTPLKKLASSVSGSHTDIPCKNQGTLKVKASQLPNRRTVLTCWNKWNIRRGSKSR